MGRLQKFTQFAQALLPHELGYLESIAQFQDEEKQSILQKISHNADPSHTPQAYDLQIDRRKYSYLMGWIEQKLDTISVDRQYEWISDLEQKIMTDAITPEEEKDLLRAIAGYRQPLFYFMRFYEVVQTYRHYLLIRMRYSDHQIVDAFLQRLRYTYDRALYTNERIHRATLDITKQYATRAGESWHWEPFLLNTFYDNNMDGYNRDLAAHRLAFLYVNHGQAHKLQQVYDYLDQMLRSGVYYSRRILTKYYANRLILHAKLSEWDAAEQYGYLSIRHHGSEYLQHLTNLSAVLLRQNKNITSLNLLEAALPEMRKTQSHHDKTGFAAFYIKSLFQNQQYSKALRYADSFLRIHDTEQLFLQRWHTFFTAYCQLLTQLEQFDTILSLARKYHLLEREQAYAHNNSNYLPHLLWYLRLAEYKEGKMSEKAMEDFMEQQAELLHAQPDKRAKMQQVIREFDAQIPIIAHQTLTKKLTKPLSTRAANTPAKIEADTQRTSAS
ncbi:MAG: hypothetical protein ACFCUI_00650 [Bernardetiaceae bacterium]